MEVDPQRLLDAYRAELARLLADKMLLTAALNQAVAERDQARNAQLEQATTADDE